MTKEYEVNSTPRAFPAPRRIAALAAFALALVAPPVIQRAGRVHARPQDKPNIANEVEKKEGGENRPADPNAGKPKNGKGPKVQSRPSGPPAIEVTFRTDQPATEVFLKRGSMGMQSLGKTDAEGRLSVRLPRGRHTVTASRPGARIQQQSIEVRPDANEFTFNLALPTPPEKKEEVAEAAPPEVALPEQNGVKAAANSEDVVRRFLDAKESEPLTADDWQQVQEQTRAALQSDPSNDQLKAQGLLADGQVAYLRGDHATALVAFNKALIASPEYVAAHYGLGNAYLATNQPAEAFKAYQRAATLDKDFALAYKGMGDALTKQHRTKEAAQYYGRAKSFGQQLPTNTGLTAARELKKRKKWAEALKEFEEIAKTEPLADVFIDIGDCYAGLEQPLSASRAYLKATEVDPKAALAHYKYGEVMFKLREYAAAMEALERALALDTTGAIINRKQARERANEAAKKLGLRNE